MVKKAGTKKLTQNDIEKIFNKGPKELRAQVKYLCGNHIASGLHREVYEFKFDPEHYVVKVENNESTKETNFANICEWRNNINYSYTPLGKWMCPIAGINETGRILIMRRARIVASKKECPEKIPPAFTDTKIENFGFVDGKFVVVDYPFILADQRDPIKKAKWWSEAALRKRRQNARQKKV